MIPFRERKTCFASRAFRPVTLVVQFSTRRIKGRFINDLMVDSTGADESRFTTRHSLLVLTFVDPLCVAAEKRQADVSHPGRWHPGNHRAGQWIRAR